jgi:hypothetical protein
VFELIQRSHFERTNGKGDISGKSEHKQNPAENRDVGFPRENPDSISKEGLKIDINRRSSGTRQILTCTMGPMQPLNMVETL